MLRKRKIISNVFFNVYPKGKNKVYKNRTAEGDKTEINKVQTNPGSVYAHFGRQPVAYSKSELF